jgi:DNA polymerase-3 subunit gamma/tau
MESEYDSLKQSGAQWGVETLLAASQIVDQTLVRMRQTTHGRTLLEIAVVRLCQLEDLSELARLVAQLKTGSTDPASAKKKSEPAVASPHRSSASPERQRREESSEHAPVVSPSPDRPPSDRETRPQHTVERPAPLPPVADASDSPAIPLTTENADRIWKEVILRLDGLAHDAAASYAGVAIPAPHRMAVKFAGKYNMLDRPERRAELERMLAGICGEAVKLEFAVVATEAAPAPAPVRTSKQMQRETLTNPFVAAAIEMFDCEVVRVQEGPPPAPAAEPQAAATE